MGISGSGAAGFVQGLQGGIEFGQNVRSRRQREKLTDALQKQADYSLGQMDFNLSNMSPEELAFYESRGISAPTIETGAGLEDPFLYKMLDFFGGGKKSSSGGTPDKSGLGGTGLTPSGIAPAVPLEEEETAAPVADGGPIRKPRRALKMQDGGGVARGRAVVPYQAPAFTPEEIAEIRARAAASRRAGGARMPPPDVTVDASRGPVRPSPIPDGRTPRALQMARGAGRAVRGALPYYAVGAGGAGGVEAALAAGDEYDPNVEPVPITEMRRAGIPDELAAFADPAFYRDMYRRAAAVPGGIARGIMNPVDTAEALAVRATGGKTPPRAAIPAAAPAAAAAPPAAAGPATGSAAASQGMSARTRGAAIPQEPMGPPAPEGIDLSQVDYQDVPDMTTKDWTEFRARSLTSMRMNGVPLHEAMQQVDDQVTSMQQKGFTNFAMQGMAMQETGNLKGAMAAYRAAFQYFPSGTDVKFGVYNGQIVGVGVDEKTGKPVKGSEMVLDSERVAALIDNFRKPEAWQYWAKDRREFQQKLREYGEVTKPLAEAQGTAALTNAQAAADNAATMRMYREAEIAQGGAGGGMKPSDWDRSNREFLDLMLAQSQLGALDEETAIYLASQMAQVKQRDPSLQNNVIMDLVLKAAKGQQ